MSKTNFVKVYIGIGSNLGDKEKNCKSAVGQISQIIDTKVLTTSKWYTNPALTINQGEKQPDYINGAIKIETKLEPQALWFKLKELETKLGRETLRKKWAPRIIDLDILMYDQTIIDTDDLTIPHPELHKRIFVLQPLYDIEPKLRHPILGLTIEQMLKNIQ